MADSQTSAASSNGDRDRATKTNLWERLGATGRIAVAAVALVSVVVGVQGDRWRTNMARDERLLEIRINRERAAQDLQVQVFAVFSEHIATALESKEDRKVALLAALYSNFSEVFDTRAVFEAIAGTIDEPRARHELRRLAKRVARRQAQYIEVHAGSKEKASDRKWLVWRNDIPTGSTPECASQRFELPGHDVTVRLTEPPLRDHRDQDTGEGRRYHETDDSETDDVSDLVWIGVSFVDPCAARTQTSHHDVRKELDDEPDELFFTLSYMDAPYYDNIWLRHEEGSYHRIAILLHDIDTRKEGYWVDIEVLHFPGHFFLPRELRPAIELMEGGRRDDRHKTSDH